MRLLIVLLLASCAMATEPEPDADACGLVEADGSVIDCCLCLPYCTGRPVRCFLRTER